METHQIRLSQSIDAFLADRKISPRQFGLKLLGDTSFVQRLRQGRSPCLRTVDRILVSIGQDPLGPRFRCQVEIFLSVTGVKPSYLGEETTGSRSFVSRLRCGSSPTLTTVDRVCKWMHRQASEDEWQQIQAALDVDMSEPERSPNGRSL